METTTNDSLINPTAQWQSSTEPTHTCEEPVVFSSLPELPDDDVALLTVDENLSVSRKYCESRSRCCIAIMSILVAAIVISGLILGIVYHRSPSHSMMIPSQVRSTYSSAWTTDSQKYCRTSCLVPNYYYEVIEVTTTRAGNCTITSNSSIDTYGYIYTDIFDPSYPDQNLLVQDDDGEGNHQFKFTVFLQPLTTYLLVATTFSESVTGAFSIVALGPANVDFTRRSTPQTSTTTETSTPLSIQSTTYSAWTENSQMYRRYDGAVPQYYYAAIEVRVTTTGNYSITSTSNVDTYGSIYTDIFDPTYPGRNLLAQNDDDGGNGQFKLTVSLQPLNRYVLVATTYRPNVTETFGIHASGPGPVTFRF